MLPYDHRGQRTGGRVESRNQYHLHDLRDKYKCQRKSCHSELFSFAWAVNFMIESNLERGDVSLLLVPLRGVTSCRTRRRFLRNGVCRPTRHSDQIEPVMNVR